MPVMYLCARVSNEGAHRLAWAIGTSPSPGVAVRELEALIGINTVDRLLGGTLTPSAAEGAKIAVWSRGEVRPGDFYRGTALRWGDRPATRGDRGWRLPMAGRVAVHGMALLRAAEARGAEACA
jgi:hypothetical protein